MHEQSETYGENGQFYLGYGRGTAVPGQRLPNTPTFLSPESAEPYAIQRSKSTPKSAENPLSVQQAWERAAAGGTQPKMPSLSDFESEYQKSLSAKDLEKDYRGPSLEDRKTTIPEPPQQGPSQGLPPAIQQRFERPFGLPKMPVAPASLAAPGAGILGSMLGQGVAGAGEALVGGKGPLQAAKEGAGSALGAGALGAAGKGISKATSALRLPAYAEKISSDLADYLKKEVPAWEKISNVKDMLFSQRGVNKLHRAYDESLAEVVKKGAGKQIQVPAQAAEALGVEAAAGQNLSPAVRDALARAGKDVGPPGMVKVDAGELAQAMNGKGKGSTLGAYRAAAKALDEANIGDPAARKAYRTAMGLRDYISKTGAITPQGTLDVMKAQAGLVKKGQVDELLKRDLGEDVAKILVPGGKALKKGSLAGPLGATGGVLGGLSGAVGGHALGPLGPMAGIPLGAGFGAHQGAYIGSKIPTYKGLPDNVTMTALQQLLQRLGGMGGGTAAQ